MRSLPAALLWSSAVLVAYAPAQEPTEAQAPLIETTPSGLKYEILKKGDGGDRPKFGDTVEVHYTGTLEDGTEFDSSRRRGQPASFRLGNVIEGWNEGLQLMSAGARYRFTIPGDLAYGAEGRPPRIPPNATLIFDVELLGFTPGPRLPEFAAGVKENQKTTDSGIVYEVLKEGSGDHPTADDVLVLNYAFWTPEGRLLQSTAQIGQPVKASPSQLGMTLAFMKEAPLLMNKGARYRFEVPAALSFKNQSIPGLTPGSITVWELELVDVVKPLPIPAFVLPKDDDLTTTPSGLKYQVVRTGSGTPPKMGEQVSVHYAGWLTDGTPFDSSFSRGEMSSFRLGMVIAGWNEGLQLMSPGSVYRFVIPPDLGYGMRGSPPVIGPDATLVFYVELKGEEDGDKKEG